jgi:AcrR family transcriptional regulator
MAARPSLSAAPRARRADARRNIERILDAAVEELAEDPDVSMEAVARRAGVVRATLYVHFPTREALIAAVNRSRDRRGERRHPRRRPR